MKTMIICAVLGSALALGPGCASTTDRARDACGASASPECVAMVSEMMQVRATLATVQAQAVLAKMHAARENVVKVCQVVPYGTGSTVKGSYAYCQ